MRSIVKTLALATVLGLPALLAPGRADAIVTSIGDPNRAPCDAFVEFFDVAGTLVKITRLVVRAAQSQAANLGVSELISLRGRVPVSERLTIGDPDNHPVCRASLEVFDRGTGRTVASGDPNEKTYAEAFFPALSVATGEAVLLNAVSQDDPNEAPCPILLTFVGPDETALGQRRATVPGGAGTFLDVGIEDPDLRVLLLGVASRVETQRTRCRAFVFSMEVYDGATGITSLLISDPDE